MLSSRILCVNGRPEIEIDGRLLPAAAYTTYFEERSRYEDFIKAGYRIFFVNISMTALPINSAVTGFTPSAWACLRIPHTRITANLRTRCAKFCAPAPMLIFFRAST